MGHANCGQIEEMRAFYFDFIGKYKQNKHDMDALIVLSKNKINILQIIEQNFDLQKDVSNQHLIFLHRLGIECGNNSFARKVSAILETKSRQNKIKSNVISYFEMNGAAHSIATGYAFFDCDDGKECEFDSRRKVDALMKAIEYKMDTSQCTELPSEF